MKFRQPPLFDASSLAGELRSRSLRGGVVTMAGQAVTFVLSLGSLAVLGRLIDPSYHGLVAMVTAFTGFALVFKDLGLSEATVQRDELDEAIVTSMFWINASFGLLIAAVVFLLAPLVAAFYEEPRLVPITRALSVTFLIAGLGVQHRALLTRAMRFTELTAVAIASQALGVAAAVSGAFAGLDAWALVLLPIVSALVSTAGSWVCVRWWPGLPGRRGDRRVREMLGFGLNLGGFNALNYFSRNADNILIGRFVGDAGLGLYSRAYQLLLLPITQLNAPLSKVTVPALGRLNGDPERFARYYLKVIRLLGLASFAMTAFMAATADELIVIVLGPKWVDAAPLFRILAIAGFGQAIATSMGWLYVSTGRTRTMFRLSLLFAPIIVTGFLIGVWAGGAVGVAWSYAITTQIVRIIGLNVAFRGTRLSLKRLERTLAAPAVLAALIGAGAYAGTLAAPGLAPAGRLALASAGAALAGLAGITLSGWLRREAEEAIAIGRELLVGRRARGGGKDAAIPPAHVSEGTAS